MLARPSRRVLLLLALGLLVRLPALPLWGTFDTEVQKAWSARAATAGVADIYGPTDREILDAARQRGGSLVAALATTPVPRTRFLWGSASYFVDYPPGSVLVLAAAGTLYELFAPELPNRRGFNAAINLAPLLGSIAIVLLLQASLPGPEGWRRALAFWLNPAVILAAPVLGYQDTVFGALALAAVLALISGRHALAAGLIVASGLVKPQGVLLLPTLLLVVLRDGKPVAWLRSAAAGAAAAILILLPWWSQGHLLSALDGCRRPLTQTTLAPLGLNVWWIAGWVMQWVREGPWPFATIVGIDTFRAWAGWDPRSVSRILLGLATLVSLVLLARAPREERWRIALSVILQVHAYALFATSVHENHTLLAVILAPLFIGAWSRGPALFWSTTAFAFLSLFFAAGFGRRIMRLALVHDIRMWPVLDLSVVTAALHVVLVGWMFLSAARAASGEARAV